MVSGSDFVWSVEILRELVEIWPDLFKISLDLFEIQPDLVEISSRSNLISLRSTKISLRPDQIQQKLEISAKSGDDFYKIWQRFTQTEIDWYPTRNRWHLTTRIATFDGSATGPSSRDLKWSGRFQVGYKPDSWTDLAFVPFHYLLFSFLFYPGPYLNTTLWLGCNVPGDANANRSLVNQNMHF